MAGIDEAGRGCLAGPVVAAAVILPTHFHLQGLTDSKQLTAQQRDLFAPIIRREALAWGMGVIWPKRIDKINILQATFEAMAFAVTFLGKHRRLCPATMETPFAEDTLPELLLVDGNKTIPEEILASMLRHRGSHCLCLRQKSVIHGDSIVTAISAASVLAKTWRDRLMCSLSKRYPGYGLEIHKGYGTKAHYTALSLLGPSPVHRLSFRGVTPFRKTREQ